MPFVPHVFDVETYPNYFLALFKNLETDAIVRFQISPNRMLNKEGLLRLLSTSLLIGFNSTEFDIPIIQLALKGYSAAELKDAADDIIVRGMKLRDFGEHHGISKPPWNHVDLINVAPLKAGLKLYAARLHCKKIQDLPFPPGIPVTADQAAVIAEYCVNDLNNTATLYQELRGQIALREEMSRQYKQDLRSRSDAQIAEHVISAEVEKINGMRPKRPTDLEGKSYKYNVPSFISYKLPQLRALLETIKEAEFTVGASGAVELPKSLSGLDLRIGSGKYRIGIGGLHSSETKTSHVATDDVLLIDRDVASYYPAIILSLGLFPEHLGPAFLTVYRALVEERLAAKKKMGEIKARLAEEQIEIEIKQLEADLLKYSIETESKKIVCNGAFGKLGSKWSVLYSPNLLVQVTVTGQLALLMLIEMLEEYGIRVVSANTDGIVVRCPKWRKPVLDETIANWEQLTGFTTEETRYKAIYSKDVNSYIAIKTDGKVKGKGLYANPWEIDGPNVYKLHKNPCTTIVTEALIALLRDGVPVETTIRECRDIRKFTSVRTVGGGAKQDGVYIGKVVRWIYPRDPQQSVINYNKSGYKVPKSDNSRPLMELPDEFPDDISYEWYIAEARNALNNLGYAQYNLFREDAA